MTRDSRASEAGAAGYAAAPPEERIQLTRFSDITPTPVRWLAKGWLPRGSFAVLIGDEGIGKSLWWVQVAAAVSTGRGLPEIGLPAHPPGDVVVVLTEDSEGEVSARLDAAGADRARIQVASVGKAGDSPLFPDRTEELLSSVRSSALAPSLVVVDVWLDTVTGSLSVRDAQQSGAALAPWRRIAAELDAAVLLVGHTNRLASGSVRDKTGATASLRKKSRSFIFAMRPLDEDGKERRDCLYIGPDKTNSGGARNALEYAVHAWRIDPAAGAESATLARLDFVHELAQPVGEYLRERHAAEAGAARRPSRDDARAWLIRYMNADPDRITTGAPVGRLKRDAAAEGLGIRTVERVMQELGESRQLGGVGTLAVYRLAGQWE